MAARKMAASSGPQRVDGRGPLLGAGGPSFRVHVWQGPSSGPQRVDGRGPLLGAGGPSFRVHVWQARACLPDMNPKGRSSCS